MLQQVRRAISPALLALGAMVTVYSFFALPWKDPISYDDPPRSPWNVSTEHTTAHASQLGRHIALIVFVSAAAAALLVLHAIYSKVHRLRLRLAAVAVSLGTPAVWIGIDGWAARRYRRPEDRDPFHDLAQGFWWFAAGCLIMAVAASVTPKRFPPGWP